MNGYVVSRRKPKEMNQINTSAIIVKIEDAALNHHLADLEHWINKLDLSDQLELHRHLSRNALQIIREQRHQLAVNDGVKEHIIWYDLSNQPWSDAILAETIAIYQDTSWIAMESIVLVALKQNKATAQQVRHIGDVFASKEVTRQMQRWKERQGL